MGTLAHLVPVPRLGRRRQVAAHPGFAAPCRAWCPVVREKAGFTHDRGKLGSDVRGKRFSTHGAEDDMAR